METRAKQREFALDMLLETEAECRHIHIKKRVWYRTEPDASLFGKSFLSSAEEVGFHGRIISQRTGTNKDEHVDMVIFHVVFSASSHPSWTNLH